MAQAVAAAAAPPVAPGRLKVVLGVDQLVANLGRFSLLPVLGVLLLAQDRAAGPSGVGAALFAFTAASGLSALLVNRFLHRLPYSTQLAGSMMAIGLGFGVLPLLHESWQLLAALGLAGFGISVHMTLATVLVAEVFPDAVGRHRMFSLFQIAGNAAAAAGPCIAGLLYTGGDARPLLGFVAAMYAVTAVVLGVFIGLPRGLRPPATSTGWPIGRDTIAGVARDRTGRRVVAVTVVGAFVYAQFYSAFALLVAYEVSDGAVRGALLAGPAALIVVLQTAVSGGVTRLLRRGLTPLLVLCIGSALFGVAMLFLGAGLPVTVGAFVAVGVFAVAEMVFQPMVSTAFTGLGLGSQVEAYGLRQLAWTAGEALGSLCGGTVFLLAHRGGGDRFYWLALVLVALVGTAVPARSLRRKPARSLRLKEAR